MVWWSDSSFPLVPCYLTHCGAHGVVVRLFFPTCYHLLDSLWCSWCGGQTLLSHLFPVTWLLVVLMVSWSDSSFPLVTIYLAPCGAHGVVVRLFFPTCYR